MRLVVILTLGLGVWGPLIIEGEKIVFVVPRYIRRSFTSTSLPFYNEGDNGQKMRHLIRGGKRPYFGGQFGGSQLKNAGFFPGEKHRVPQSGGDDFDQGFFAPNREANHVVIPHGKGISHGISFGKGYIPQDEFPAGGNENYEFPTGNGNTLDYMGQNNQEEVKFEDQAYPRFRNQDQDTETRNMDWNFQSHESSYVPTNYDQETNHGESRLEFQEGYKSQETQSAPEEKFFLPKTNSGEESSRAFYHENVSPSIISSNVPAPNPVPQIIAMERKPAAPIILQDTVDMKEYIEKLETLAKSWPSVDNLRGFKWGNQILNPPGLTIPNYRGFNSWSNNLARPQTGSYQVQEDSVEEPNHQRSYRTIMI